MATGQTSAVSAEDSDAIRKLLFKSERGSFHTSWNQGFFFDPKMQYAIF